MQQQLRHQPRRALRLPRRAELAAVPPSRNAAFIVRLGTHQEYDGNGILNVSFVADTCQADFNGNGSATIDDIFLFLNAWFAGNPAADMNGDGIDINDIFTYLNLWFSGCP